MKVSGECKFEMVFIRINDVLHLMLPQARFVALQSWYMTPDKKWVIEITLDGGVTTPDYATKERWKAVLACLELALYAAKDHVVEFDDNLP